MNLLQSVGVTTSSVIRVTGPSALSALLWFCRHGYDQVGYVRPDEGSPHEDPDAVIVAHTCDAIALKRLVNVGRQVRPGGLFIFQLHADSEDSVLGVNWLLESTGFTVERRIAGSRRALIVARRRELAFRKAA